MKPKNNSIATTILALMLTLFVGLSTPLLAKNREIHVGKKGVIKIDTPTRVGNLLLAAGNYQFQHQHVAEGDGHIMVIRKLSVFELSRSSSLGPNQKAGEEVGRIKCTLEPLGKRANRTEAVFGVSATGEKTIKEVKIQGDNFKHVF